ncbi:4-(cytidine 5'-diphospho)-2-C-methyl-D-erythritol kinase [Marinibacterium sp. SX1]|uniref:4-(cytidine 5'-diphospho)-2-C-methyl-D-erythritol kinase n=1 Tax=Marinibacterium sp. SX1 TaxID=3388424 RepID=UPI003D16A065
MQDTPSNGLIVPSPVPGGGFTAFAPAKVNLALHVTGQRDDGYHLLDSVVVFAGTGDQVTVTPSDRLDLSIDGPEGQGLAADDDNLVLRAARFLDPAGTAAIRLTKRLPVASGIGGGSADAAATLRALSALWSVPLPAPGATAALGADVPVCLAGRPCRMQGIGDQLSPLPALPDLDILLVNPRVGVPTGAIFKGLPRKDNPPLDPLPATPSAVLPWLAAQRNDLAPPALAQAPVISETLAALADLSPLHHGMSGSGATCFALFARGAAAPALDRLRRARPDWWSAAAAVL